MEEESERVTQRLMEIKGRRQKLRRALRAKADFGCECDDDYCHTEKANEPISTGETDMYCHDDQDGGKVTITCLSGRITVTIYRAVWSIFNEYDTKKLEAGETWKRNINGESTWYDQTNRVDITGEEESKYSLTFVSWDA